MVSTLEALAWPLVTERLSIRPATVDDAETTWPFRKLEEITHWMTAAPVRFEEYRERFVDSGRLGKTLVIELDGAVVGDLMVAVEDAWAQAEIAEQARGVQAEIGWCLAPAHQGRGIATEAVQALLALCFERLSLRRVVANCFADNEPSWRLMERLGMRREAHTLQESLHRSGRWLDGYSYALLADEWRLGRSVAG